MGSGQLAISEPGDKYEQEADRVAGQVMRMRDSQVERQKEGEGSGSAQPATRDILSARSLSGSGQPLPESVRSYFEPRFGHDFSKVRVHADARAVESAREISARAYTVGREVVFGAGEYTPETTAGRSLLAHELTHVVQQEQGAGRKIQRQEKEGSKAKGGKTGGSAQPQSPIAQADPCGGSSKAKSYKPTNKGVTVTLGKRSFGNTSKLAADVLTDTFGACKVGNNWRFFLNKLTVKIGSAVQPAKFRQNVDKANDKIVTSTTYRNIINDLRPSRKVSFNVSCAGNKFVDKVSSYSPRKTYWKRQLTVDHEAFHRKDWDAHYRSELTQAEQEIWGHRIPTKDASSAKDATQKARQTLTRLMINAYQRTCKTYTPQQESRAYDAGKPKYQELVDTILARAKQEKWQ